MWNLVSKVAELKIFTLLLGIWGCNRQSKYWLTQVADQSCWTSRKFYKVLAWHILFWFILTGRSMQRIYHNVTWSRPLDIILVQAQRQSRNVTADWQRKSTHQGSARRASTHEIDCKKMGFWTRVGGARGRERNQIHKVASFLKGQPQGGRRTQSGMRTWSQALRASRGWGVGYIQHDDLW